MLELKSKLLPGTTVLEEKFMQLFACVNQNMRACINQKRINWDAKILLQGKGHLN